MWDDSGSMLLETSPESTSYVNMAFPVSFSDITYYAMAWFGNKTNSKLVRDPKQNALFFDPFKEYKPWINADGSYFADANYASLYKTPNKVHPDDIYIQSRSSCKALDLTKRESPCYNYSYCDGVNNCKNNKSNKFWPGDFFYNGKRYNLKNKSKTYNSSWFYSGSPSVTGDELLNKAANWFTYYRDRKNVAKAALGYVLQDIPDNVEIGFTTFNHAQNNPNNPLLFNHKKFEGSYKQQLYDSIYNESNAGNTPLREALLNVNNYIKNTDSLWFKDNNPLSCRRAYNIIITDGNWTDNSISFNKNSDGTAGNTITGIKNQSYQYDPDSPNSYKDSYSGTLADIAMEFWKNDLRPDLENTLYVEKDNKNPAFWQHIVTHSISLNDDVVDEIPDSWPNVISSYNSSKRYMDLWHASLNSKGGYLHSTDFDSLRSSLSTFLHDAANLTSSVGFLNTGIINSKYSLSENPMLFKTYFNPNTWSGEVKGFTLDSNGNELSDEVNAPWVASKKLPSPDNRNIIALLKNGNNTSAKKFRWADFSNSEKELLGTESIANYFRGERSQEGYQYDSGTQGLRVRSNPLGDFINAKPVYVAKPPFSYSYDNYSSYKENNASRTPVVYAASNAGFLHGFNANTGVEMFAITPQKGFEQLKERAQYGYEHKYTIDGSPKPGDAYFGGKWNTILVTPLATGGQGVFSVNITNPDTITENNASQLSGDGSWQFDDSNDKDLGNTFAAPVITRINSSSDQSTWAVVLGNGYNNTKDDDNASSTGNAVLYVLDAATGNVTKKLDTGVGTSKDPERKGRPNGLSSPTIVDYNNDGKADYVYAGDIFGNVWKFDISDKNSSKWTVSKLFHNNANKLQSITSAPDVKKAPSGTGIIVYVATGRFMGNTDKTTSQNNSIYAIYDNFSKTSITRNNLVAQTITANISNNNRNNRVLSNNNVDLTTKFGWYIDLPTNEMVLNRPKLSQDYLLLSSYIPDATNTMCVNNQKGYLYAVNPLTGGQLESSVIDTNGDNKVDDNDLINDSLISGIEVNTEFNSEPIVTKLNSDYNMILLNTQEGNVLPVVTKRNYSDPKRRSWKKVRGVDQEI